MRRYPFFISDFLLLLFMLSLFPLALMYNTAPNYALAFASLVLFGVVFVGNQVRVLDFNEEVNDVKEIRSWESDFLSLGTLRFDYRGEGINYRSRIRQRLNGSIPVDCSICLENGSSASFEISREAGRLSMRGDKRSLASVKKEVSAFSRKYRLRRMRNSDGLLGIDVRHEFTSGNMKKGGMARFLRDYLELGYGINKKLKARR